MLERTGDASKRRIFAMIIDNLIAMMAAVPIGARILGVPDSLRWLLVITLYLGYFAVSEAVWSKTLGKALFDLKVVQTNGEPADWGSAIIRTLARVVEVNPILLGALPGALVVTFSRRKQRIGDLLAETLVVRTDVPEADVVEDPLSLDYLQDLPEPDLTPDQQYAPWKESG